MHICVCVHACVRACVRACVSLHTSQMHKYVICEACMLIMLRYVHAHMCIH